MARPLRTTRVLVLLALVVLGAPATSAADVRVTEFSQGIGAGSGPTDIAPGPDGNLWFTETYAGRIGRITPSGVVTEFSAGITPGSEPDEIVAGPDGNLWFTEHNAKQIGRITPSGVVTEFPLDVIAYAITAGPDGRLWFTGGQAQWTLNAVVGAISTSGAVYRRVAYLTMTYPYESGGIATGPSGDLWFLQIIGNDLGRVTTSGVLSAWPMWQHGFTPGMHMNNIVLGPDGNIWAAELGGAIARITDAGAVTEFPVSPGVVSIPEDIAAGADGNLWFTAIALNAIGRITPSGTISLITDGVTPGGRLWNIAPGPNGTVWYTQQGKDLVGRVTLELPGIQRATTAAAASLTTSGAGLRGSVHPEGVSTDVRFEYGTTTAYGARTASQALSGNAETPVGATLTGLAPDTTYHYRVVAEGGGRTVTGDDRTLRTAALPAPVTPVTPVTPVAPVTPTAPARREPAAAPAARPAAPAPSLATPRSPAACAPRTVTVAWTVPRGLRLRSLTVAAGGRTARLGVRKRSARVTLTPDGGGTAAIRIAATTTRGASLRATRAVAVCGAGAVGARMPALALRR